MNLADLRLFLATARGGSLQAAADEAHLTPSALSKAIRRVEDDLGQPLFDRSGKALALNRAGERLRERALQLLRLADETRAEFGRADAVPHCRVAAPPVLQWRHAGALSDALAHATRRLAAPAPGAAPAHSTAHLSLRSMPEDDAIAALARGEVDFALVTGDALPGGGGGAAWQRDFEAVALASLEMQLAAGRAHPLCAGLAPATRHRAVRTADLLAHEFACPSRSLFGGVDRGARSDGWRDDQLPRRIRYWVEDLQVLMGLVRDGRALAYLPSFALDDPALVRLRVPDCPYRCQETSHLVWRPGRADGWQGRLVAALRKRPAEP